MKKFLLVLLLIPIILPVVGCGLKGPLYYPLGTVEKQE